MVEVACILLASLFLVFGLRIVSKREEVRLLQNRIQYVQELILTEQNNSIKTWEALIQLHEEEVIRLRKLHQARPSQELESDILIEQRFLKMFHTEVKMLRLKYEKMNEAFKHD